VGELAQTEVEFVPAFGSGGGKVLHLVSQVRRSALHVLDQALGVEL